jgi:carbamoyltransferase
MISPAFERLFGQRRRHSSDSISQFHMDIAASIQAVVESIMLKIARNAREHCQIENLCLAGGVALNCVANGKILKESGFENIWIQPAAGDAGGALGAAYAVYYQGKEAVKAASADRMQNALLGPSFTRREVEMALRGAGQPFEELRPELYHESIARFLAEGMVVGYFKGRAEFGPRALGARSILADPRKRDMQAILNKKIKFRESFRPFAPAVLQEHAADWFEMDVPSPYMLLVFPLNGKHRIDAPADSPARAGFDKLNDVRSDIPAVTHVDYSARIQTVNKNRHPDFYRLIDAFYKITGVPVVVNTSFNRMDEPIVHSPSDAIDCFVKTDMDILIMEDFMVRKNEVKTEGVVP